MNGWIALDIDGTITLDKYSVPQKVIDYLRTLEKSGWNIVMATGRSFVFASMALSTFDFPYTFLVQNGSAALQMPGKRLIFNRYISSSSLDEVEKIFEVCHGKFLVYAGYEKGDFCYGKKGSFSKAELDYLASLQKREKEEVRFVDSFQGLGFFPLIKCFGLAEQMTAAAKKLRATDLFQVAQIRDPFTPNFQLLLVTDRNASKGCSLKELIRLQGRGELVIAAGDDENDLSLFDQADVKIAMPHAPKIVQEKATLIAPPTADLGIISALEKAVRYVSS
jgi:hydroxymethylpyrimidine pyrophosphatase-like HAD family hydrolase